MSMPDFSNTDQGPSGRGGFRNFCLVIKAVLLSPRHFFESMKDSPGLPNPYLFLCVCSLVHTMLVGLSMKKVSLMVLSVSLVNGLLMPFITAFLLFLIITKLFGRAGSYASIFQVNAYTAAVSLFSWVPMAGIALEIYRLYLIALGLYHVCSISITRAWSAILLTMLAYIACFFALNHLAG